MWGKGIKTWQWVKKNFNKNSKNLQHQINAFCFLSLTQPKMLLSLSLDVAVESAIRHSLPMEFLTRTNCLRFQRPMWWESFFYILCVICERKRGKRDKDARREGNFRIFFKIFFQLNFCVWIVCVCLCLFWWLKSLTKKIRWWKKIN